MKVAIVGPTLSGKSTLFQAITGIAPDPAKYHGATPQPGMVDVPDPRLDWLTAHYEPEKRVPATLEFLDFSGVALGERTEHGRALLAAMRDAESLLVVLGAYDAGRDLAADARAFADELLFADLEQMTKRVEKLKKSITRPSKTQDQDKHELALLTRIVGELEEAEAWTGVTLDEANEKLLRGFHFLSQKPVLTLLNVGEQALADGAAAARQALGNDAAVVLCATIERDVAELDPAERAEFLEAYGIAEPARERLIHRTYRACGLASFFTVGDDECRAWTIAEGDTAVVAAGKVHTDLARGFIRAECFHYDDLVEHGDEKGIKAAGKFRLEGKSYIVKDGDILCIRASV